jgi:hypothetical protein
MMSDCARLHGKPSGFSRPAESVKRRDQESNPLNTTVTFTSIGHFSVENDVALNTVDDVKQIEHQ